MFQFLFILCPIVVRILNPGVLLTFGGQKEEDSANERKNQETT